MTVEQHLCSVIASTTINPSTKAVYMVLVYQAHKQRNASLRLPNKQLSGYSGCSMNTVGRSIDELVKLKLIIRDSEVRPTRTVLVAVARIWIQEQQKKGLPT